MGDEKFKRDINKIISSEILKRNLINASLFLTAYEFLKKELLDNVVGYYELDKKYFPDSYAEHKEEIKQIKNALPKEHRKFPLLVYSRWFLIYEALNQEDYDNIVEIWQYRNKIAHELYTFLLDSELEVDVKKILQIRDIVEKVGLWWFKNVEAPINPSVDQDKLEGAIIRWGSIIILEHLISAVLVLSPNEEEADDGSIH